MLGGPAGLIRGEPSGRAPIGRFEDVRAYRAWPQCERSPDVRVEYMPGKPRDLRFVWLRCEHGLVTLCDRHAAELPAALGSGRGVGGTWLQEPRDNNTLRVRRVRTVANILPSAHNELEQPRP